MFHRDWLKLLYPGGSLNAFRSDVGINSAFINRLYGRGLFEGGGKAFESEAWLM